MRGRYSRAFSSPPTFSRYDLSVLASAEEVSGQDGEKAIFEVGKSMHVHIHSPTRSLTHSSIHPLPSHSTTHSLTHPLPTQQSLNHPPTHSPTLPLLTHSLTHPTAPSTSSPQSDPTIAVAVGASAGVVVLLLIGGAIGIFFLCFYYPHRCVGSMRMGGCEGGRDVWESGKTLEKT